MIEEHKHCIVCGKVTEPEKSICSPSCEEVLKKQQKQMARSRTIMLVFFVVMIIIIVVLSMLQKASS